MAVFLAALSIKLLTKPPNFSDNPLSRSPRHKVLSGNPLFPTHFAIHKQIPLAYWWYLSYVYGENNPRFLLFACQIEALCDLSIGQNVESRFYHLLVIC